jgi:signal peptidase I
MSDTIQTLPPAQSQHHQDWEGGEFPPLKLDKSATDPRDVRSAEAMFELPLEERKQAERRRVKKPKIPEVQGPATLGKTTWTLCCVAVLSVLAYFMVSRFVVTAVIIQGRSMQPTLKDGERYYLNRWRYLVAAPKRGDLVVLKDPGHNDFAVKRIVAGPNDWVNMRDNGIYLNGKRLSEPYLPEGTRTAVPDRQEKWILLGPNQYYVLGDNRANSEDSRYYGVIARKNLLGVLIK